MIHNASIEKYRTPIGAVKKGEEITLRLLACRRKLRVPISSHIVKIFTGSTR